MNYTIKKITLAIVTIVSAIGIKAQTTVLADFDFNSSGSLPISANTTASNITASISGTEANAAYGGVVSGSGAFVANTSGPSLSMANSSGTNTRYWTLTLGGSDLNKYINYKVYFQTQRSTTGAQAVTVSYSTNGSSFTNASPTASPADGSFIESTIDLSSASTLNNQTAVYIRFSASGASGSGTLRIDNLEIQGSQSPWTVSGGNVTFSGGVTAANLSTTGTLSSGAATVSGLTNSGNLSVTGTSNLTGAVTTGALTSGAHTASSLTSTGNLSVGGTSNFTGAVTTSALTSGAHTASSLISTGNLSVTGTSNFTGAVTTGALTSGATSISSLNISALGGGSSNKRLSITPGGGVIATAGNQWSQGGDVTGSVQSIGSTDNFDLSFIAGGGGTAGTPVALERMRLTANGRLGIATSSPSALLHVNTQNAGTLPGLIVDNANPAGAAPEFIVNSDGSLFIYDNIPTNGDIFNLNTQTPPDQNGSNSIYNKFRVTGDGYVGIGSKYSNYDNIPPQNNVSAYKMLTVNGDASFANGTGGDADGLSALEILSDGAKPTRRGISVTKNSIGGDFDFYINSLQTNSQFNFVDGKNGVLSSTNPALVTIGSDGSTTIKSTSTANSPLTITNSNVTTTDKTLFQVDPLGNTTLFTNDQNDPFKNVFTIKDRTPYTSDPIATLFNITADGWCTITEERPTSTNVAIFTVQQVSTIPGSPNQLLRVLESGRTIIGTQTQTNTGNFPDALLTVFGKTVSQSLFVTNNDWADYVFKKDYKLMSLNDVEKYISTNQHLPNIPSANEIAKNGQNIGDLQTLQMEKIEEMYLYMIELNKKVERLEKENGELKKSIERK